MAEVNKAQLEKYRHDLEVIRQTAMLLQKDLGVFGIEIRFSGSTLNAYEELKRQLVHVVSKLTMEQLYSLLYRIDVDESRYRLILDNEPVSEHHHLVTYLILEKELSKAVFRKLTAAGKGKSPGGK